MNVIKLSRFIGILLALTTGLSILPAYAQPEAIAGQWQFNQAESDITDRRVEAALKAMGQKVKRRLFDTVAAHLSRKCTTVFPMMNLSI